MDSMPRPSSPGVWGRLLDLWDRYPGKFLRRHGLWVTVLAWVIVYVFGCVGTKKQFSSALDARHSWFDTFYRPLQLFLLDDSMVVTDDIVAWELEAARIAAPIVATWTVLAAALGLFHERLMMFRVRRMRGHVVICGLGRKGTELARDFRNNGDQVVVIDLDEENEAIATCRELNIRVLIGDAREDAVLRRARVDSASRVVAITGDDGVNVEIAVRTYQIVKDRDPDLEGTVYCHAHVVDLRLATLLSRHRLFSDMQDAFEINIFNVYQNSARMLFEAHPLDHGLVHAGDTREVHLVLIGFGQMGESVALQAAKTGHYANRKKPRITVVDTNAEERKGYFCSRYPRCREACRLQFVQGDIEDWGALQKVGQWVDDRETITTIVIALDDDAHAVSAALGVLSQVEGRSAPIFVRMSEDAGLTVLLEGEAGPPSSWAHVHAFGIPDLTCTRQILVNEELEACARALHEDYVEQRKSDKKHTDEPSMQPWERLDAALKDSNRQQADHIPVKLRAVSCRASRPDESRAHVTDFNPQEVELLAEMEHARWCAERLLAGWSPGPRDVAKKTSPYLVPWDELEDGIKKYDRDAVHSIPRLMAKLGRRVYREGDAEG